MNPLALNQQIILQELSGARNALNEPTGEWVNFVTTDDGTDWAAIRDITGRQYMAAGGTQNDVTTRITIRHRPGVVAAMRAVHGLNIYEIKAVLGQDGRFLDLMCARGSSNG